MFQYKAILYTSKRISRITCSKIFYEQSMQEIKFRLGTKGLTSLLLASISYRDPTLCVRNPLNREYKVK